MGRGLYSDNPSAPPYTNGPYSWSEIVTFESDLTVDGDLTVEGSLVFGDASVDTITVNGVASFLQIVNISDNKVLQFEGVAADLDGLKVSCDNAGDSTIEVTAGKLTINTSDNVITASGEVMTVGDLIATNIQATNFKALDGTASLSIASSTGVASFAAPVQVNDNVALQFEGVAADLDGMTIAVDNAGDADISVTAGTLVIGTSDNTISMAGETLTVGVGIATSVQATNYKALDGSACFSIADSTGVSTFSTALNAANIQVTNLKALDGSACLDITNSTAALGIAGDVTIAAGKVLYIRDASQSIASGSDDLMTLTSPTLTLAGATAVNLDGPTTVTGLLAMDSIVAGNGFSLAAFGDGAGLELDDSNLDAAAFYMELPSGGAAITAGSVLRGIRTRFLISQAQTNNISIYANTGHIRPKANLAAGVHVGQMCYYEQSGTVAIATGGIESAMAATVETSATFTLDSGAVMTAGYFSSNVDASSTMNGEFVGVKVLKGSGKLDFVSGMEFTDCVSSEIFKFADDGTIVSVTNGSILNDISATTNAGFIRVMIGSSTRYIAVYEAKS